MVASVHRVKPHEVFDRHTVTGAHVLATGGPSTTFLVEPGERPFQADARLSRCRAASRVKRLVGLPPLWKYRGSHPERCSVRASQLDEVVTCRIQILKTQFLEAMAAVYKSGGSSPSKCGSYPEKRRLSNRLAS